MFVRKAPELTPCQPSSQAAIPDMTEGMQARPHWRGCSNLTVVPFANGAGVPQMGRTIPYPAQWKEAPLPQNVVSK